jgi:hypothetical protein
MRQWISEQKSLICQEYETEISNEILKKKKEELKKAEED